MRPRQYEALRRSAESGRPAPNQAWEQAPKPPEPARSSQQTAKDIPREVALGDKAERAAGGDQPAVLPGVPARDKHDVEPAVGGEKAGRDLESIDVRQLDVEQDELGVELLDEHERRRARFRLPDDVEALVGQQRPGAATKARMIVDDERPHLLIPHCQLHAEQAVRITVRVFLV